MVVIFGILGVVILGGWYFFFHAPAQQRLEDAKTDALAYLDSTLGSVVTSQAGTAAAGYRTQIWDAGSTSEVAAIRSEVASAYNREKKRADLLAEVERATNGTFYSFSDLASNLESEVNAKTTLEELEVYGQSGTIGTQATSQWRSQLKATLKNLSGSKVVMRCAGSNSPYVTKYVRYMAENEARDYIDANSWQVLRELRFENLSSYEVPIIDIFQRAPTVKPGSIVDVYVWDYNTGVLSLKVGGTTVRWVIYPKEELDAIAWILTDGATTYTYSANVWETIKAATAGDPEAAAKVWRDYAKDVIESARSAGVGDFNLKAIYVVEVPGQSDAQELTQYEQYMSATKDLILVAKV